MFTIGCTYAIHAKRLNRFSPHPLLGLLLGYLCELFEETTIFGSFIGLIRRRKGLPIPFDSFFCFFTFHTSFSFLMKSFIFAHLPLHLI